MVSKESNTKKAAFFTGSAFLFFYWLFGFDGITFSDDVYYLLAGKKFWEGTMDSNAYHFSTRWGAYVPSGLVGFVLGFDPDRISLISLISYLATLWLLFQVLPKNAKPWILVLWFSTQVFFLHFLTKVYPDSLLVFWTVLIPFAAVYRNQYPFWAAIGIVSGLFFGFLTKETIVFLAPFPLVLFFVDRKNHTLNSRFYLFLTGTALAFGTLYLGYFWIAFGDPFFRFVSIEDGHYISEFTYADKDLWVMLKRLTLLPVITFVERAYWMWIVFAIPGIVLGWKNLKSPGTEFVLAFLSLILCFWGMSTSLRFYNPLYLNPRHLIILVPILSFLIVLGWEKWLEHRRLKLGMLLLIGSGIGISAVQQDLKMVLFQLLFFLIILSGSLPYRNLILALLLLAPALFSVYVQQELKQYKLLTKTLQELTLPTTNEDVILTNNFLVFSKEVLLPSHLSARNKLVGIEKTDSLQTIQPPLLKVFLYRYYRHAYPKEQVDVDALEQWLRKDYLLTDEKESGPFWIRNFRRRPDL